ncbi:MAG: zinc ribbon domain-containing protein [Peptococcaceae bacterium]|nr:zinc ribbon domain-containing protein [Peptococcaceae bacterium]
MPIYEFRCLDCGRAFEKLFIKKPDDEADLACPACKSESLERIISKTNYVMNSGKGTPKPQLSTRSCHPGSGCTTLEIPGCE